MARLWCACCGLLLSMQTLAVHCLRYYVFCCATAAAALASMPAAEQPAGLGAGFVEGTWDVQVSACSSFGVRA